MAPMGCRGQLVSLALLRGEWEYPMKRAVIPERIIAYPLTAACESGSQLEKRRPRPGRAGPRHGGAMGSMLGY
jgi:hypothetical protein